MTDNERGTARRESRQISDAEIRCVAAEWDIPENGIPTFAVWLRNVVCIYDNAERSYANSMTRQQKIGSLGKIETAARDLEQKLKDPWIENCMLGHERQTLWIGSKARQTLPRRNAKTVRAELVHRASAAIDKRVRRDIQGVARIATRMQEIVRDLETRVDNVDEQTAARSASKPARRHVDEMIWDRWERVLGRSDRGKKSGFVKAVVAIDQLLGLPITEPKAIEARFKHFAKKN